MFYTPKIVSDDKIRRHHKLEFDMTQILFWSRCYKLILFGPFFCKLQGTGYQRRAPAEQLVESSSPDQQWTKGGYSICKCIS